LVRSLAQLLQKPGVLDGDHGLRSEVLHYCNLLGTKRAHFLAIDDDRAIRPGSSSK
jgi:hypothetical protein